jgi:hypothetical protein
MKYSDLDINTKINLKGFYSAFLKIAVERFKGEQEKKIYRFKNPVKKRKGRWVPGKPRTRALFNMYGRMRDMGVGRGTSVNYALVRKRFGAKRTGIGRKPARWYSKRRRAEELRLGEILQEKYSISLINLVESSLNQVVTIPFS